MDIRKFVVFISGVVLLATSLTLPAQDGILRAANSPIDRQFRIEIDDGTVVVGDHATETIYISKPSGEVFEVSFADAIAAAESSPAKRQQLLNELKSMLTDTGAMFTVAPRRVATDTRIWPIPIEMCGDVICISPREATNAVQLQHGPDISLACAPPTCDPSTNFPCNYGPCNPFPWPDNRWTFYSGWGAGWGWDEGGGSLVEQQLLEYDKWLWERERDGACSEKNTLAAETSAIGAMTGASCAAIETGLGALGCVGGAVVYLINLNRLSDTIEQCHASYPGYRNW